MDKIRHAVAQLVDALHYQSEGRGFDSMVSLQYLLTLSFRPHYGSGVASASNGNEYKEYFLGVKAAGAKADNLTAIMCRLTRNLGASTLWSPVACHGTTQELLELYVKNNANVQI